MLRCLIVIFLIFSSAAFNAQGTLIRYLRNVEPSVDSTLKANFDDCFISKYISMEIKDCQISHLDGLFITADQKVDSSKILAYRFYYRVDYDKERSLSTQFSLQVDPNGKASHIRFNGTAKLYKDEKCELLPVEEILKLAQNNKLKGEPESWTLKFFLNGRWNNNDQPGMFELHVFRYYGGKDNNKKFQGHIYNLSTGALTLKTKGKVNHQGE